MRTALLCLAWLASALPAFAQGQLARVVSPEAAAGDVFGSAVGIADGTLLVGAWLADAAEPGNSQCQSGAVYRYELDGTSPRFRERWLPADAACSDHYGHTLAVTPALALVASDHDGADPLARPVVHVYERAADNSWPARARLHARAQTEDDGFGTALACDAQCIAIGSPSAAVLGYRDAGSVALYERRGEVWEQSASLVASVPCPGMRFGAALAIEGEWLLVGAPGDPAAGYDAGAVYLYQHGAAGWELRQRLLAPAHGWYDAYGNAVDLHGGLALVAARGEDADLPDVGAAYLYQLVDGGLRPLAELRPSTPSAGLGFGWSVALAGRTALVATPLETGQGTATGALWAYRETREGWSELARFGARGGRTLDFYGQSLAAGGELAFVGASGVDVAGQTSAGAAYLLQIPEYATPGCSCGGRAPCGNRDASAGCANSTGAGARLYALGSSALEPTDLELSVERLPSFAACALWLARPAAQVPFGDGWLCLRGGAAGAASLAVRTASAGGGLHFGPTELGRLIDLLHGGTSWSVQLGYRDPDGPCGHALSATNSLVLRR